jgi:hypothetical protein
MIPVFNLQVLTGINELKEFYNYENQKISQFFINPNFPITVFQTRM